MKVSQLNKALPIFMVLVLAINRGMSLRVPMVDA
jgi:hypothetical protein